MQDMSPDTAFALDPITLADTVGSAYAASVSVDHRKQHGLYLTSPAIARFMASFGALRRSGQVRILDPCAGAGILAAAAVTSLVEGGTKQVHIVAYEVDPAVATELDRVLIGTAAWAKRREAKVTHEIHQVDFVLANADALASFGSLFQVRNSFDLVIANPPYFKLNKADPRAQAAASIIHGQPNVYALFMAISAAMLRPGGDLITITPRSFASGGYFRAFRRRFFSMVRPETMHVFGSRRDAFARDSVLQENVILHGVRDDGWAAGEVVISTSVGVGDLEQREVRTKLLSDVMDVKSPDLILRMPATATDEKLMRIVDGWTGSLKAYGWKISTGPVVAFRATELQRGEEGTNTVPLLWLNHIHPMEVRWPLRKRKNEYISTSRASQSILVPNANYVLLRRFSAKEEKRRLVAAPYLAAKFAAPLLGLENHLNYIYRPGGNLTKEETIGLAAILNSTLLDTWFRATNGNTQVGAAEIRAMPMPPIDAIVNLGEKVCGVSDLAEIDSMVEAALGVGIEERVAA